MGTPVLKGPYDQLLRHGVRYFLPSSRWPFIRNAFPRSCGFSGYYSVGHAWHE
jgi:hypothetical protein